MVVSCFILQFVAGVCPVCWEHWSRGYDLAGAWGEQSSSKSGNRSRSDSGARKSPSSGGAGDFGMVALG